MADSKAGPSKGSASDMPPWSKGPSKSGPSKTGPSRTGWAKTGSSTTREATKAAGATRAHRSRRSTRAPAQEQSERTAGSPIPPVTAVETAPPGPAGAVLPLPAAASDNGGVAEGLGPAAEPQDNSTAQAAAILGPLTKTAESLQAEEDLKRLQSVLREGASLRESARFEEEVSRLRNSVLAELPRFDDRKKTAADFEALFRSPAAGKPTAAGEPGVGATGLGAAGLAPTAGGLAASGQSSEDKGAADGLWAAGDPRTADSSKQRSSSTEAAMATSAPSAESSLPTRYSLGEPPTRDQPAATVEPWADWPPRAREDAPRGERPKERVILEDAWREPPETLREPVVEAPYEEAIAPSARERGPYLERERPYSRGARAPAPVEESYPRIPQGRPGLAYVLEGSGPVSGTGALQVFYRHAGGTEAQVAWNDGNRISPRPQMVPVPVDRNLMRRARHPLDQKIASVLLRLPRQSASKKIRGHVRMKKKRHFPGGRKAEQNVLTVTEKAWRTLLPWLLDTGRFYLLPQGSAEAVPVMRDDQPPLEFNLLLERIPRRGDYHLTCRFMRDSKTLLYKSQVLLVTEGETGLLLRRSGKLSSVDFSGSVAWLRALRRGRFRHVPRRKIPSLLKIFERSTTLPTIHFPGTLKIHKIEGLEPRPELKLESGPQEVTAEVTFRYGEDLVRAARPGKRFFSMKNRRLIVRNLDQEAQHAVNLLKQGFSYNPTTHFFTLSADKLALAAPELFELGWTLHGKKMPFRPPTDMDVNVTTGPDYIDVEVTVHFGDQNVDVMTLLDAIKQGNRMIPLKQGAVGVLPSEWLDKNAAWLELGVLHEGKLRFRRLQSAIIDALVAEKIKARLDDGFQAEKERLATFDGVHESEPTAKFHGQLRPYQRFGLGWLLFLDKMGWGGCLADDMGLGKTIQALALLQYLKDGGRQGTSLVVTPKSLIFNWMREAKRFTPDLKVLSYTGLKRNTVFDSISEYDLVLTTYGTVRRDAEKLAQFRFFYLILDEAQAIKNAESQNAKTASLLQGERRLILSGTPVENHLGELWSLFDFLNPGMLGTYAAFRRRFASDKAPDSGSIAFLRRTLRPFILRRKKEEVTPDLPQKIEETILCEMEPEQKQVYQEVKERCRNSVLAQVKAKGMARSKLHILEALLRLRQAACHPGLISENYAVLPSGKINAFLSMLDEVEDAGHKVLIFSQFTSLLAIVRKEMDQLAKNYEYLDGQTRDRAARVDRFQNDDKCRFFLISLKAGGLGLNLTAADYVFILDPWWNPAVETQAIDRAHRIGQDKKVFAYRFVSKDSIEERITDLQESKRKLADAIIAADENFIRNLTKDDLEVLFS